MIALSDYLDYLNAEVVTARRRADLLAVDTARAYAEHEYLRYFRAPRFVMPKVRMEIPVRISELDQETEFDFDFRARTFLGDLNREVRSLAARRDLSDLPPLGEDLLEPRAFGELRAALEDDDRGFARDVDAVLDYGDVRRVYDVLFDGVILPRDRRFEAIYADLAEAFYASLRRQFRPARTNVNSLLVTPEADSAEDKSGELLVRLTVDLEASGVRIRKLEGPDGGEEVILDD